MVRGYRELTDEEIINIRLLYSIKGMEKKKIAMKFGLEPRVVTQIINRKIYKNVI